MTIRMRARKQPFMSLEVVHINCDQCRLPLLQAILMSEYMMLSLYHRMIEAGNDKSADMPPSLNLKASHRLEGARQHAPGYLVLPCLKTPF